MAARYRRYLTTVRTAEGISLSLIVTASHGQAAIATGQRHATDAGLTPTSSTAQPLATAVAIAATRKA